jgi:hypothetical protein
MTNTEVGFCHYHQEILIGGEPCFTCEDEAENERLLMEDADAMADEMEEAEDRTQRAILEAQLLEEE